ncbi:MAG: 4Fe-4S cluster-binding domain-containing protein [Bacillota bacterium]
MKLRIAGIQKDSIVDGPGVRLSVYFQGCSHCCPGCHNPETHDHDAGYEITIARLVDIIESCKFLDGVTFSGGEPFEQAPAAAAIAREVSACGFNLVLYSGYTFEQLLRASYSDPDIHCLLNSAYLLVDRPFIQSEQDFNLAYRGSRNQRLIDLPRSLKAGHVVEWEPAGGKLCRTPDESPG